MAGLGYTDHLVRCFLWMLWYVPAFGGCCALGFPSTVEAQLKEQLGVAATMPVLASPMKEAAILALVLVCARPIPPDLPPPRCSPRPPISF